MFYILDNTAHCQKLDEVEDQYYSLDLRLKILSPIYRAMR